jgi:hypothetical protein
MIEAESITRKENKNATEDFIRGSVWAVKKIAELYPCNDIDSAYGALKDILDNEDSFPDVIAAEKESFEFTRGASWGYQRFVLGPAKDKDLGVGDIMNIIAGFRKDYTQMVTNILKNEK